MSQVNIDKLSLFTSQTIASAGSRPAGPDPTEEFNELLERASKTPGESASDAASSNAADDRSAATRDSRNDDRAESTEPAESEQAAEKPAESQKSDDDQDASEPEEAEAAEAEDDSKVATSSADEDSDDAKEDDSESASDAAENAVVVEIIGATIDDSVKTTTDTIAAQAELAAEAGDVDADTEAEVAGKKARTNVKRAAQLAVGTEEPAPADDVQAVEGENVGAVKQNRNAERQAEFGAELATDEQAAVAEEQASKHGERARETASRGSATRKAAAADASVAPSEPEMAEAAVDTDARVVVHRDAKKESDTGRDRPATAGDGTVEMAPPRGDANPPSENHAKSDAIKPNSELAARGAAPQGQTSLQTEQIDRVQFVQRVVRAFEAASARGGNVRVRLHPPELGSLQLEMKVQNGVMTARLHAESTAARNLLLDNLPMLRDRLAQHDIKIQQFEVDLGLGSSGGSPHGPDDQQRWQEAPRQSQTQLSGTEDNRGETASTQAASRVVSDSSLFDVTI